MNRGRAFSRDPCHAVPQRGCEVVLGALQELPREVTMAGPSASPPFRFADDGRLFLGGGACRFRLRLLAD